MRNLSKLLFAIVSLAIAFSSCESVLENEIQSQDEKISLTNSKIAILDSLGLDSISVLEETEELKSLKDRFKDLKNNRAKAYAYDDNYDYTLSNNLYAIRDMTVFITTQSNGSNNYLRSNGKGKELTFAPYKRPTGREGVPFNFTIKVLPATSGIPYMLYSSDNRAAICVGYRNNNQNDKLLMVQSDGNTSTFGCSWDFIPANGSLAIQSQDIIGQGSGGWMDIYNFTAQVGTDNKTSMSKYNKEPKQHFKIIPEASFSLSKIKYVNQYSARIVSQSKHSVIVSYTNYDYRQVDHDFYFADTKNEYSYFKQKISNIDFKITKDANLKFKAPEIIKGQIFLEPSVNIPATLSYEPNINKSIAKNLNATLKTTVKPRTRTEVTYFYSVYNVEVEFEAIAIYNDREIKFVGTWSGTLYVDDIADEHYYDYVNIDNNMRSSGGKINVENKLTRIAL